MNKETVLKLKNLFNEKPRNRDFFEDKTKVKTLFEIEPHCAPKICGPFCPVIINL